MKKFSIFKISFILITLGLAIFLSLSNRYDSQGHVKKAFPNLIVDLKKINKISIQYTDHMTSISREKNKWYLDNYNQYPVDIKKINNFFLNLSNGTFIDKKNADSKGLKKLGLDNTYSNQNQSKSIQLHSDNNILYHFIIGKKSNQNLSKQVHYYRDMNTNLVWLFKSNLQLPEEELSWINTSIINIERWRIKKIEVTHTFKKDSFAIYRSNYSDQNYKFLDLPKGFEFSNSYSQNALAASFENIDILNIIPKNIDDNFTVLSDIELSTFDGLVINFQIIKFNKKKYIRIQAKGDRNVRKELTEEDKKIVGMPAMKTFNDVEKEVIALDFSKDWLYEFDENTMNEFYKKRSDIIVKK